LKHRRLTEPIEKDLLPLAGLQIEQFESTWSQEFQHPFELSLEIVAEHEYELEPGKIELSFQHPPPLGNLSFTAIECYRQVRFLRVPCANVETGTPSSAVSRSHSTLPEITTSPLYRQRKSSFEINEVKGLLQERFNFHLAQIISYSSKIIFRENNRNGFRSNEIELSDKRGAIRIRKMIFSNHNMRRNFLSEIQGFTGC